MSTYNKDPKLVGDTNETAVLINKQPSTALLDTGSCVSVVSQKFYEEKLKDTTKLQPMTEILNIECADGQKLPYLGYIETDLVIMKGLPDCKSQPCLLLVVPDTNHSSKTPIILGTYILKELLQDCKDTFGDQFLQKADLHVPWYICFRTMVVRDRTLKKNNNRIAIVRSAMPHKVILKPNETVNVRAYLDNEIDHCVTPALIKQTEDSSIPDYLDITPGVITYEYGKNKNFVVTLSNLSTNTTTISPKQVLCEIQPVEVTEEVYNRIEQDEVDRQRTKILDDLNIEENPLMEDQQRLRLKELLMKHKDIFSISETDIGQCDKIKHRIDLINEKPFKQRHRRIPPNMIDEVRQHLEQLLSCGIIRPSKSPWASNIVLVRKKSGKLKLCVDYRSLNERTVKDSYALPRIEEVFDCLLGSKYFSTIDMKFGYHQVEVEEEHKPRTSFTAGPLGFWEYNKMPFGLTNSPATYQRLMEECLKDLNMNICVIYLDDLIIFSKTFDEHLERLDQVFSRLKECSLKLAA